MRLTTSQLRKPVQQLLIDPLSIAGCNELLMLCIWGGIEDSSVLFLEGRAVKLCRGQYIHQPHICTVGRCVNCRHT